MYVPGRLFQLSIMFVSRVGAYPSEVYLPTNIRLGWIGLPGTNTLAYWAHLLVTKKKLL
jgi:hypothetical protein